MPTRSLSVAAYAGGITALKVKLPTREELTFASRGERMAVKEYTNWLSRLLHGMADWTNQLDRVFGSADWDKPTDRATQAAWSRIQRFFGDILNVVHEMTETPPPLLFLAVHRQVAGAAVQASAGLIEMLSALVASSPHAAQGTMTRGQELLDQAGSSAERIGPLLDLAASGLTSQQATLALPNQRTLRGVLTGRETWFDDRFPELRQVGEENPALLSPLIPLGTVGALLQDPQRRMRRVAAARDVLLAADATGQAWVTDVSYFCEYTRASWQQLVRQHDRLVTELRGPSTAYVMDTVLDVLSKLFEGPFRRYGAILAVAGSVARGKAARLDEEGIFRVRSLGAVHNELASSAPALVNEIDKMLRHAEAHYDYHLTSTTVRIRHLTPKAQTPRDAMFDELAHDDVIEQALNLGETTLAMAIALLLWSQSHPNSILRETFRSYWLALG